MTALNWTERARVFLKTGGPPSDETSETPISRVLAGRDPPVSEKTVPRSSRPADTAEARCQARRERLLRWGWPATEAEALAQRLARRDRSGDVRVSCTECRHHQPGRCGNHHAAGLRVPALSKDLAGLLQTCPGFAGARPRPAPDLTKPDIEEAR